VSWTILSVCLVVRYRQARADLMPFAARCGFGTVTRPQNPATCYCTQVYFGQHIQLVWGHKPKFTALTAAQSTIWPTRRVAALGVFEPKSNRRARPAATICLRAQPRWYTAQAQNPFLQWARVAGNLWGFRPKLALNAKGAQNRAPFKQDKAKNQSQ
jgi:hypothetical protein